MPPSGRSTASTTRPSNREREKSLPMGGRRTARKPSACSRSLSGISVASSPAALGERPLSDSVRVCSPRARHGSFLPARFETLGSRASLASPFRSTRPAVPDGVREERARGGRSAARSPRRVSTAPGWGGSRYPVWVSSKITPRFSGSSESSIRRRSKGAGPLAPCEARPRGAPRPRRAATPRAQGSR